MASKFILIAGSKEFELIDKQSPRGLRNKDKRPTVIELDVKERLDLAGLKKHIDYLITLSMAMENAP